MLFFGDLRPKPAVRLVAKRRGEASPNRPFVHLTAFSAVEGSQRGPSCRSLQALSFRCGCDDLWDEGRDMGFRCVRTKDSYELSFFTDRIATLKNLRHNVLIKLIRKSNALAPIRLSFVPKLSSEVPITLMVPHS